MTAPASSPGGIEFIERMGRMLEAERLPRIAGRLFGALLLAPREVSLDDLAEDLGVSKASVSINARLLEERGLIERVSRPGDRRDFYEVTPDLFRRTMEQRLARWRAFHDALTAVRPAARREARVVRRLDELTDAYAHVLAAVAESIQEWSLHRLPTVGR